MARRRLTANGTVGESSHLCSRVPLKEAHGTTVYLQEVAGCAVARAGGLTGHWPLATDLGAATALRLRREDLLHA